MLIQFSATNHRSLRDKQTLSMVASTDAADDPRLIPCPEIKGATLPVVAIYGANASGKSNVLGAMGFMQQAVLRSHRAWEAGGGIPWEPFLLADPTPAVASYEMQLLLGGTRYRYGFTLGGDRIHEEWLHAWPNAKKQVWLERQGERFKFGKNLRGENETIRKLTRPNSLFVSAAAQNNHLMLSPLHLAFKPPQLVRRLVAGSRVDVGVIGETLDTMIAPDASSKSAAELSAILNLLHATDTGIADFGFAADASGKRVASALHRSASGVMRPLPLSAESEGTLTLLHLGLRLFQVLEDGGLFVIDELEASLHPALARHIVALFQDPRQNPRRAQLVFTTHDTNLLGPMVGEPALRRDQVWLTEKDEAGATKLYPLTDYKPRREENLERGYLQGRYGAIPFLGALVSNGAAGGHE